MIPLYAHSPKLKFREAIQKCISPLLWVVILLCPQALHSLPKVTLIINHIPHYTPDSASIYVAGNFNNWQEGLEEYRLKYDSIRQHWSIDLFDTLKHWEYHFSRGSIDNIEADNEGRIRLNRSYDLPEIAKDTLISHTIALWLDLTAETTLRISQLPANTPVGSSLYLSSNLNNWRLADSNYRFTKKNGAYELLIPPTIDSLSFQISRGSPHAIEGGYASTSRTKRIFTRKHRRPETLELKVWSWKDLPAASPIHAKGIGLTLALVGIFILSFKIRTQPKSTIIAKPLLWLLGSYSIVLIFQSLIQSPKIFSHIPQLVLLPNAFWFLMPSLYMLGNQCLLLREDAACLPRLRRLHLLPIGLYAFSFTPFLMLSNEHFLQSLLLEEWRVVESGLFILAILLSLYAWHQARHTLRKTVSSHEHIKGNMELRIALARHLQQLWLMGTALWLFIGALEAVQAFQQLYFSGILRLLSNLAWALPGSSSLLLIWILLRSTTAFDISHVLPIKTKNIEEAQAPTEEIQAAEDPYLIHRDKLEQLMEDEVFLDQQLNMQKLADMMEVNKYILSKLIHDYYDKNFNDYINSFRVDYFIKKIETADGRLNFGQASEEAGFNSKATFNRAFKKATGTTPREYFKNEA